MASNKSVSRNTFTSVLDARKSLWKARAACQKPPSRRQSKDCLNPTAYRPISSPIGGTKRLRTSIGQVSGKGSDGTNAPTSVNDLQKATHSAAYTVVCSQRHRPTSVVVMASSSDQAKIETGHRSMGGGAST